MSLKRLLFFYMVLQFFETAALQDHPMHYIGQDQSRQNWMLTGPPPEISIYIYRYQFQAQSNKLLYQYKLSVFGEFRPRIEAFYSSQVLDTASTLNSFIRNDSPSAKMHTARVRP